jgi:hypothetical protein
MWPNCHAVHQLQSLFLSKLFPGHHIGRVLA